MRKLVLIATVVIIASAAYAQSVHPEATGVVTAKRALIYEQPGTRSDSKAYVLAGDRVEITGFSSGYFSISFTNRDQVNTTGYVRSEDIRPSILSHATVTYRRAVLNPEEDSEGVSRPYLVRGDRVQVIFESTDRALVRYASGRHITFGWIDTNKIRFD